METGYQKYSSARFYVVDTKDIENQWGRNLCQCGCHLSSDTT